MEFSALQIAQMIGGRVEGDEQATVSSFAKIEEGKPGAISFLSNPKYAHYIYDTQSSVVLVDEALQLEHEVKATLIRVKSAYEAVARLLQLYESMKPKRQGIDPLAFIAPTAEVGEGCYVGAFAYIGDGAKVGKGCQIHPHAVVCENVTIGDDCILYPNAVVYHDCRLGSRVTLHAGCVIGADGFGFAPTANGYDKIPQIGIVTIEDDVEIGANTCVDRSTMGSTYVRKGVKLDNLVQIAHNTDIGENTVMSAQVGVAGSTKVGQSGRPHQRGQPRESGCPVGRSQQPRRQSNAHRHASDEHARLLQVAGHLPAPARSLQGIAGLAQGGRRTEGKGRRIKKRKQKPEQHKWKPSNRKPSRAVSRFQARDCIQV